MKKWQLTNTQEVSPSKWFPLEKRTYQLPDGQVVDDFYVTTLADSVHIIPILTNGRVVMIRMYKPGIDEIMIQFPAGRYEPSKHENEMDAAIQELREEVGINAESSAMVKLGVLALMTTKASEKVHVFMLKDANQNAEQDLDQHEEIEVLKLKPSQIDQMIGSGEIWDAPCIAIWHLVKSKDMIR